MFRRFWFFSMSEAWFFVDSTFCRRSKECSIFFLCPHLLKGGEGDKNAINSPPSSLHHRVKIIMSWLLNDHHLQIIITRSLKDHHVQIIITISLKDHLQIIIKRSLKDHHVQIIIYRSLKDRHLQIIITRSLKDHQV